MSSILSTIAAAAVVAAAGSLASPARAAAQDPMPGMPHMPGMHEAMPTPLGIPMNRMGSGTTWIPDAVTVPSRHFAAAGWELMVHGFIFGQYDRQDGPRGDEQWGSLNWAMLMASRPLAGGTVQLRTMLSLDPWSVTERGYPLLLQTGETYAGAALYDRQHPHDFWMEVAALYERELSSNLGVSVYVAPSGEPALGPVAFMHRPSAMDDPVAPLSHHWQDATHISFGVVTAGVFSRRWKLEGSYFNGREPDEERWGFDPIRLDSWSGRLTFNPDSNWSFTGGYGHLDSPGALHPGSVRRLVLSALHGRRVGADGQWASAIVYGLNDPESHASTGSLLIESELILDRRNTVFGRWESVARTGEELALPGLPDPELPLDVLSLSLGYLRELGRIRGSTIGIGARGTVNLIPRELEAAYGSRTPTGVLVFARLRFRATE